MFFAVITAFYTQEHIDKTLLDYVDALQQRYEAHKVSSTAIGRETLGHAYHNASENSSYANVPCLPRN